MTAKIIAMARVYLALGSNLGERMENLRAAVTRLAPPVTVTRVSPVYETEPWGVTEQPRFLNLVLEGETELEPLALLAVVKRVERELGRVETIRYGPRLIDLDILLYDDLIFEHDELQIPHPRMHERRFVLVPLAEIAPQARHPRLKKSARELLAQLPANDDVQFFAAAV